MRKFRGMVKFNRRGHPYRAHWSLRRRRAFRLHRRAKRVIGI